MEITLDGKVALVSGASKGIGKAIAATLAASGEAVGLPPGQMGNSEVGHLTIGSGRILFQDLQRVHAAVRDAFLAARREVVDHARRFNDRVSSRQGGRAGQRLLDLVGPEQRPA